VPKYTVSSMEFDQFFDGFYLENTHNINISKEDLMQKIFDLLNDEFEIGKYDIHKSYTGRLNMGGNVKINFANKDQFEFFSKFERMSLSCHLKVFFMDNLFALIVVTFLIVFAGTKVVI